MAGHVVKNTADPSGKAMFIDLGSKRVAEDELKSAFAGLLRDQIRSLGLTQTEAANFMGIKQPEVSRLVSGQTDKYTLARVFAFVRALGGDVDIKVATKPAVGGGRMRLHVALEPL